jgi:hypothetical protein
VGTWASPNGISKNQIDYVLKIGKYALKMAKLSMQICTKNKENMHLCIEIVVNLHYLKHLLAIIF